jgi:hypothetical protein
MVVPVPGAGVAIVMVFLMRDAPMIISWGLIITSDALFPNSYCLGDRAGPAGLALGTGGAGVDEFAGGWRCSPCGQLMAYLGLVPSEHTTGSDRQQGGITKMGNGPARRALVEAAWQYRAPARISPHLKKRQEGLTKTITDIS